MLNHQHWRVGVFIPQVTGKPAKAGITPHLFRHWEGLPLPPDLKWNLPIPKPSIYTFGMIPLSSDNHGGIIRSILLFPLRVKPWRKSRQDYER